MFRMGNIFRTLYNISTTTPSCTWGRRDIYIPYRKPNYDTIFHILYKSPNITVVDSIYSRWDDIQYGRVLCEREQMFFNFLYFPIAWRICKTCKCRDYCTKLWVIVFSTYKFHCCTVPTPYVYIYKYRRHTDDANCNNLLKLNFSSESHTYSENGQKTLNRSNSICNVHCLIFSTHTYL